MRPPIPQTQTNMEIYRTDGTVVQVEHEKFTCNELNNFFHGWFTLSYLHTAEDGTDMFVVTKELYGVPASEYPAYNKRASKALGRDIYGDAIVCAELQIK